MKIVSLMIPFLDVYEFMEEFDFRQEMSQEEGKSYETLGEYIDY